MKKLTWTWKKIAALIAGFFGIGTLVSCYGVYFDDGEMFSGTVTGDFDGVEKPVKGIYVSSCSDNTFTDEDGKFTIYANPTYTPNLIFEDIDGEENGLFKTIQYDFDPSSESPTDLHIKLTPEDNQD